MPMEKFLTYQLAFILTLAIVKPVAVSGRAIPPVTDTVPSQVKPAEVQQQEEGKLPDIKEVPKSRRQIKPAPVTPVPIPVKPIKIIKPKLIRPKVGLTI